MPIKIDPDKLASELLARFRVTEDAVRRGAKRGAARSLGRLVRKTPVDVGQMKNSWRITRGDNGMPGIENDAPHAGVIEQGARPHGVNKEGRMALESWAMRQLGVDAESAKAIAQAIIMRLKREGQKGLFIVKDSLGDIRGDTIEEVVREIKKMASRKAGD